MTKFEKRLLLVLALLIALILWFQLQCQKITQDSLDRLDRLDTQMELLCEEQAETWRQIQRVKEHLDKLFGFTAIVTAYAPLDPHAVEGMCYSDDPRMTASGARVVPGVTVAAGPELDFGTRLWIEGIGGRTGEDRGGLIREECIDLAVDSIADAISFGRQERRVVVLGE